MIIEIDEDLAKALLTTIRETLPENLIDAQDIAPEWMKQFILEGTIMCISREDWEDIPCRFLPYVHMLKH